jgi:putative membrane protein
MRSPSPAKANRLQSLLAVATFCFFWSAPLAAESQGARVLQLQGVQAPPSQLPRSTPLPGVQTTPTPTAATNAFVTRALQLGMLQVQLGRLALSRSFNLHVRNYAQRMVSEHGAANAELSSIAQRHKILVPYSLDSELQSRVSALNAKRGSDFDSAYASEASRDHVQAVALFNEAARNLKLQWGLASFAQKNLSVLHEHQRAAQRLQSMLAQSESAAAGGTSSGSG